MSSDHNEDRWKHYEGTHGNKVRVYESRRGGNVYIRAWDPERGKDREKSLGFKVRDPNTGDLIQERVDQAISAAKEVSQRKHQDRTPLSREVTLGEVDQQFREHETPNLSEGRRKAVHRHLDAFVYGWDRLGPEFPVRQLGPSDWKTWIRMRTEGLLDCHGKQIAEPEDPNEDRTGVKPSTVAFELASVKQMVRWATEFRTSSGDFLLEVDPTRGLSLPKNPDPARPVASDEKYADLLESSRQVTMSLGRGAEREVVRSYCYELVVLCGECGVRVGEALRLKWSDWMPGEGRHGAIHWRGEHQKNGHSRTVLVTPRVRDALEEHRRRFPGVGETWVFPAPRSDGHLRRDVAHDWWLEAEEKAGYEHPDQGGFHELRRRWASRRKHLSPVDVAAVGGWKDVETMRRSYQHVDEETMERVMLLDEDPSGEAAG